MVLITSYRPAVTPVPQIQPHTVSSPVGTIDVAGGQSIVEAPPSDRTTVLEDHFGTGYTTRLPWQFIITGSNGVTTSHSTLNGNGAIRVKWPSGSLADARWGGRLTYPGGPYEEVWLTFDMLLESPFGYPKGFKLPGQYTQNLNNTSSRSCTTGALARWHGRPRTSGGNTSPVRVQHYVYDTDSYESNNGEITVPLNHVQRVEHHWKMNSAFNLQDGLFESRYDDGTTTTHANPVTLRASTNVSFYCGSESNRNAARIDSMQNQLFFGGPSDPSWAPTTDIFMWFGYLKVEIPS